VGIRGSEQKVLGDCHASRRRNRGLGGRGDGYIGGGRHSMGEKKIGGGPYTTDGRRSEAWV